MSDTPLEALLRATSLTHGRIALDVHDGQWGASVCHFQGEMTHHMGTYHGDPVEALRAALIEDERRERDRQRRYDLAPRAGATGADTGCDPTDELADLLG
jgi:hypothetical protein